MQPPEDSRKRARASQPFVLQVYLITYNLLSAIGWSYVFCTTFAHLSGLTAISRVAPAPVSSTATSALTRIWGYIPYFKSSAPIAVQVQARVPSALVPILNRASTAFVAVGAQTAFVQSFAALEVIHSLLGWVRSPVTTAAMQVASRLTLVWGIAEKYESARSNPMYASMVISWSMAEIIRYTFYAGNLINYQPQWLLWLRYNAFFVLYPLGAGSEAALIFSTLPSSIPPFPGSWKLFAKTWSGWDYFRGALFLIWWPGLYVMYTHMIQQRRKVFRTVTVGNGDLKYKTT